MDFLSAVRASLWKTPAESGRRSRSLVASGAASVSRLSWSHLDASVATCGRGLGRLRRHRGVRLGGHHPCRDACSKSFLMEGQT